MPSGSSTLPYCGVKVVGLVDIIIILVIAVLAFVAVVPVSPVIAIDSRMGSAPFKFGLQALFAGLETVNFEKYDVY
jgi:hypothetical protein